MKKSMKLALLSCLGLGLTSCTTQCWSQSIDPGYFQQKKISYAVGFVQIKSFVSVGKVSFDLKGMLGATVSNPQSAFGFALGPVYSTGGWKFGAGVGYATPLASFRIGDVTPDKVGFTFLASGPVDLSSLFGSKAASATVSAHVISGPDSE